MIIWSQRTWWLARPKKLLSEKILTACHLRQMAKQQQQEKRNYPHVERYPLKNFNFLSCHHEGGGTLLGGRVGGGGGISRRSVQKVSPHPLRSNCIHCFCSLVNKFTIDYYFILLCHFADKDRLFGFWIRRGELIRKLSFLELDLKKIHYRVFS